jgi:hypothetical protein
MTGPRLTVVTQESTRLESLHENVDSVMRNSLTAWSNGATHWKKPQMGAVVLAMIVVSRTQPPDELVPRTQSVSELQVGVTQ